MADLYGREPVKLAAWGAKAGMFSGIGTTLGPFIGSKLGGARSFLGSAMMFGVCMAWASSLSETLPLESRKQFKLSDVNPVAFLKLFKEKTLGKLAVVTAFQSFGDYVNIYDINNLFMIKVLRFG